MRGNSSAPCCICDRPCDVDCDYSYDGSRVIIANAIDGASILCGECHQPCHLECAVGDICKACEAIPV